MTIIEASQRALEDVVRLLHQQGRSEVKMAEWQAMLERRMEQLGHGENTKKTA